MPRKTRRIYQLKVTLAYIDPPIWRRFEVGEDIYLGHLHEVLQEVMGWEHSHMHHFRIGKTLYGEVHDEMAETEDEWATRLNRVVRRTGTKFEYLYDFGDDWLHEITLEQVLEARGNARYPRCVDGARNCPPEDCGGPFGYSEYVAAVQDLRHPRHREMIEWNGRFDPEKFSLVAVNRRLHPKTKLQLRQRQALAELKNLVRQLTEIPFAGAEPPNRRATRGQKDRGKN
jgi:hypothetical protein